MKGGNELEGVKSVMITGFSAIMGGTTRVLQTPSPPLTTRSGTSRGELMSTVSPIDLRSQSITNDELRNRALDRLSRRIVINLEKGCWELTGGTNSGGYVQIAVRKSKLVLAHRLVYECLVGPIPKGLDATHGCHNKRCIRPHLEHVRPGTRSFNLKEDFARRRTNAGEHSPYAKLNWMEVREIRDRYRRGETQVQLATSFGISQSTVSSVVIGQTWKEDTE